jgi:hypothetical protein
LSKSAKRRFGAVLSAFLLAGALVGITSPAGAHVDPSHDVLVNGSQLFNAAKAGTNVDVSAPAGAFDPSENFVIVQCNIDPNIPQDGTGCSGPLGGGTANADGSISAVSVPVDAGLVGTNPDSKCPPKGSQVRQGVVCAMVIAQFNAPGDPFPEHIGAGPFLFKPAVKVTNNGNGTVTVKCTKYGNVDTTPLTQADNPASVVKESVNFLRGNTVMDTKTNQNGTVTSTYAASAGQKVGCAGQNFGQATRKVTV